MEIIKINNPSALTTSLAVLKKGGLVICPTETVYGALVDATNVQAVAKLLTYKHRPVGKAISIACCDQKMAEQYVYLNDQAQKIYSTFLPGPVTVISQSKSQVAAGLTSEKNTLGVRIPAYDFLLTLIQKLDQPVTATSANSSGKKSPYAIADLLNHLSKKQQSQIDLIIDAGTLPKNPPSLVIDTTTDSPTIVRNNENINLKATSKNFTTHSDQETKTIAHEILLQNLDQLKKTGLVIALDGPLGAGKTVFTQGLGESLKIQANITSPTYTYLKEYPFCLEKINGTLYHLDVWTIDKQESFNLLEVEKLMRPGNLIVIEWFANISHFFATTIPLLQVKIMPTLKDTRQITITQS